jgi:tRNA nucleotidyltransferase (CCA-adding enzyme)
MAIRLKDLKLSNRNSVQIIACITLSKNWTKPKTKNELTAFLLQHGLERVIRANQFASILIKDQNLIQTDDICFCWEKMPVKMLKDLEIKGSDLIRKLGRPGGSWVKKTLSYLLEKVAFQELSNDRTILLQEGERYAIQCTE